MPHDDNGNLTHDGTNAYTWERPNGLRSRYRYDAAGRLRQLRHSRDQRTLALFDYQVDRRGNRIQALEALLHPTAGSTTLASNDKAIALVGALSSGGGYRETSQASARLKLLFFGEEATLSMGQGPDHGLYDVYLGGTLWQSFDGYAASPGQRDIVISLGVDSRKLLSDGPHLLEIRCHAEKHAASSGFKVRFKQLVASDRVWSSQTLSYRYDALARLQESRTAPGINTAAIDADLLRRALYTFDRAGNRLSESLAVNGGTPTVQNFAYNAANQLTSGGATYDANGNMLNDGTNAYTWDRANRLLSMGSTSYQYDGEGRRVQQTVGSVVTKYLLDIQPGLSVVLSQDVGGSVTRFVHAPRGIHARQDATNAWHWTVQDGLDTVRLEADNSVAVEGSQNLDPFGNLIGSVNGTMGTPYGFTGELVDGSGLLDLRARRYAPGLGVFASLDPFEGLTDRPMSLNGYSWVEGNAANVTDPSGMFGCLPGLEFVFHQVPAPTPATPVPPCSLVSELTSDLGVSEAAAKVYMADLLAGIAYQQNALLGYDAMVLTMAATLNSVDVVTAVHGSVTRQLQKDQSVFSYTKSSCGGDPETKARVIANIDQYNRCSKRTLFPNEPAEKCAAVQTPAVVIEMLGCLNNYNQALVGDDIMNAAANMVEGRCGSSGRASALFSGPLATRIQIIDDDAAMRYVYSFDASWANDFNQWKACKSKQITGLKAEFLGTGADRAAMITNEFNVPCDNWRYPQSAQNPPPDYINSCCGAQITPTPVLTPTPTP